MYERVSDSKGPSDVDKDDETRMHRGAFRKQTRISERTDDGMKENFWFFNFSPVVETHSHPLQIGP